MRLFGILAAIILFSPLSTQAASVGDITLRGTVERSGQRIPTNSTLFAGDSIRTQTDSDGVIRVGRGRIEIIELSEIEIVRENPLKVVLKSGAIAFNFPKGTPFEIVTPQLEIRPNADESNLSGTVTAQPLKEDRVMSRSGRFTILERQPNGATNRISAREILVASLVMPVLPSTVPLSIELPQGPLGGGRKSPESRRRKEKSSSPAWQHLEPRPGSRPESGLRTATP